MADNELFGDSSSDDTGANADSPPIAHKTAGAISTTKKAAKGGPADHNDDAASKVMLVAKTLTCEYFITAWSSRLAPVGAWQAHICCHMPPRRCQWSVDIYLSGSTFQSRGVLGVATHYTTFIIFHFIHVIFTTKPQWTNTHYSSPWFFACYTDANERANSSSGDNHLGKGGPTSGNGGGRKGSQGEVLPDSVVDVSVAANRWGSRAQDEEAKLAESAAKGSTSTKFSPGEKGKTPRDNNNDTAVSLTENIKSTSGATKPDILILQKDGDGIFNFHRSDPDRDIKVSCGTLASCLFVNYVHTMLPSLKLFPSLSQSDTICR